MKSIRLVVTGRVQGLGYRWWTVRTARSLGIAGWVRNEPDGSVIVHAEGDDEAIAALLARCNQGPGGAHVSGVHASVAEPQGLVTFVQR